jgi:hypothetical protein
MSSFDVNIVVTRLLAGLIAWRTWRNNSRDVVALAARRFFDQLLALHKLTPVRSSVLLAPGETAFFESAADLCVKRSFMSLSHAFGLKVIDSGVLVFTDERLIFADGLENRSLCLKDITFVKDWDGAIEVVSRENQHSQFYRVGNPVIWERLINGILTGALQSFTDRGLDRLFGPVMDEDQAGNYERVLSECQSEMQMLRGLLRIRRLLLRDRNNLKIEYRRLNRYRLDDETSQRVHRWILTHPQPLQYSGLHDPASSPANVRVVVY